MARPTVMGTGVEFGISARNDKSFDAVSSSVLLVNAYREIPMGEVLWDYDQEAPLDEASGNFQEGDTYRPNQQVNISRNKTLLNGARYYVDEQYPVYSCPEVTNARDLVIHEKAGEWIVEISRREATSLLPQGMELLIHKNNSDRIGNSYGCHENYLMDRRTSFREIVEHLLPFIASRQVYSGAGKVGSENRGKPCNYQLSQRADFCATEVSPSERTNLPIINTRDEPHADREKYRRIHIVAGDSNISEYTIFLRNGVTALMLSMIEDGAIGGSLSLRNPVEAIKRISHDPTCETTVQLEDGRSLTGVEIQAEYLETALQYTSSRPVDPVLKDVIARWQHVIECLQRDPMELATQIDWVIKMAHIEGFMDRKGLDWDAPQIQMLDLQYHDSRPDKGLYFLLERQGKVERIVGDEEIKAAMQLPPEDTRAYFRGECLRRYPNEIFGVNWDSISFEFDSEPIKRILMSEPLKGSKKHVLELLDNSLDAAALMKNLRTL